MNTGLSVVLFLALAVTSPTLQAEDWTAARAALLVHESEVDVLDRSLEAALRSTISAVRTTAARVVIVRSRTTLLPLVRELLTAESDIETARELLRAQILLGGGKEVDSALETSARFENRLDGVIAVAVARLGAAEALPLYFSHLSKLKWTPKTNFFLVALWGKPELILPTASRTLGRADPRAWANLLRALGQSGILLKAPLLPIAINHPNAEMRAVTVEYVLDVLLQTIAEPSADTNALLLEALKIEAEAELPHVSFRREVIRRLVGGVPIEKAAWQTWLASDGGAAFVASSSRVFGALTPTERKAVPTRKRDFLPASADKLLPPHFYIPAALPNGIATAVLNETRCTSAWLGVGSASVDRQGRVQTLDIANVPMPPACRRALETLTRLSLAHNNSILSGFQTDAAVFVKPEGVDICLDEGKVPDREEADLEACSPLRLSDDYEACTRPVVSKRIEPRFTAAALQQMGRGSTLVEIEALITEAGCVRHARLVRPAPNHLSDLNRESLLALLAWRFEPARLGNVAVPVLFKLTINYKRTR